MKTWQWVLLILVALFILSGNPIDLFYSLSGSELIGLTVILFLIVAAFARTPKMKYICNACGNKFEKDLMTCPECGRRRTLEPLHKRGSYGRSSR